MKRIILTIAAMLLLCVGAFAQSSTPLKGDVNGDGKVDVADITAIIQIMKNGGAEVAVTGITLDKSALTLSANGTGTIKATIAPSNATSQGVTWTSDDPSTATVTALTVSGENATVTWKKAGTVTITAKAVGDDSKKATCSVTCLAEGVVVYYWYVGATQPTALPTSDSGLATGTNPGWRKIGNSKPSAGTVIFDGTAQDEIVCGTTKVTQYFAINSNVTIGSYDSTGADQTSSALTGPTVSNGMNIYTSVAKSKTFGQIIKVK